jgi:DNA ligase N terminus
MTNWAPIVHQMPCCLSNDDCHRSWLPSPAPLNADLRYGMPTCLPVNPATPVVSRPQTMLLKPKPLTLKGVYASLRAIALTKGPGSAQRKQDLIKQLISRCRWDTAAVAWQSARCWHHCKLNCEQGSSPRSTSRHRLHMRAVRCAGPAVNVLYILRRMVTKYQN